MFNSVSDIKSTNEASGQTWFGRAEMRFFNTVIESDVIRGRFFITSDRMEASDPKRYTVRRASEAGRINTVGDLCQYDTLEAAVASI